LSLTRNYIAYFSTAPPEILAVDCEEKLDCTPVPETAADCGLSEALSVKAIEAAKEPAESGVNVIVIVQLELIPKLLPIGQLLLWKKADAFVP